jgi:hypothetical protein
MYEVLLFLHPPIWRNTYKLFMMGSEDEITGVQLIPSRLVISFATGRIIVHTPDFLTPIFLNDLHRHCTLKLAT